MSLLRAAKRTRRVVVTSSEPEAEVPVPPSVAPPPEASIIRPGHIVFDDDINDEKMVGEPRSPTPASLPPLSPLPATPPKAPRFKSLRAGHILFADTDEEIEPQEQVAEGDESPPYAMSTPVLAPDTDSEDSVIGENS